MTKICTSLEQSRKLLELGIDINTADMYYPNRVGMDNYALSVEWKNGLPLLSQEIPAWSLTALLEILPNGCLIKNINGQYKVLSNSNCVINDVFASSVDACMEMITRLHELNLL